MTVGNWFDRDNECEENVKTLKKSLYKLQRRTKKKKRNFSSSKLFDHVAQTNLITSTNESYNSYLVNKRKQLKLQLQHLHAFQSNLNKKNAFVFDSDSFPVVFDSGASSTSTSEKKDFIPDTFVPMSGVTVLGITSGLQVEGHGTVSWNFYSSKGGVIILTIEKVLCIPNIPTRLLSPQQTCQ